MPVDVRRATHIRYKMSERADLGVGEETTAEELFPDDTVPTIDSILPDPNVHDEGRSASNPSVTPLPITSRNESDAAFVEAVKSEKRCPRPLVNPRAPNRPKQDENDDTMSMLRAQIIQDGICLGEEHQRREQERKDRKEERKAERAQRAKRRRRKTA